MTKAAMLNVLFNGTTRKPGTGTEKTIQRFTWFGFCARSWCRVGGRHSNNVSVDKPSHVPTISRSTREPALVILRSTHWNSPCISISTLIEQYTLRTSNVRHSRGRKSRPDLPALWKNQRNGIKTSWCRSPQLGTFHQSAALVLHWRWPVPKRSVHACVRQHLLENPSTERTVSGVASYIWQWDDCPSARKKCLVDCVQSTTLSWACLPQPNSPPPESKSH